MIESKTLLLGSVNTIFFERVSEIIESENLTYSEDAGSGLSF